MSEMLQDRLRGLAFCWRIERTDGAGLALTSATQPIERDGTVYRSDPGMMPSAIVRKLGLEPDSGEVTGVLSSDAITSEDLGLGRWNGAAITLFACDWSDPDEPDIELLGGTLGEVAFDGHAFTADLLGASARLDAPVCPVTSPECRAAFGDPQCRVDLAGRSVRATVIGIDGRRLTLDGPAGDRFRHGRLRYVSGGNCGRSTAILRSDGNWVELRDLPTLPAEPGTKVELREG